MDRNLFKKSHALSITIVLVIGLLLIRASISQAVGYVVTPSNLQGWAIFEDQPGDGYDSVCEIQDGLGSVGTGSVRAEIPNPSANGGNYAKCIVAIATYDQIPLNSFTSISYDTYLDPSSTNTHGWYLNIYLKESGTGYSPNYDYRIDFAPTQTGGWETWTITPSTTVYLYRRSGTLMATGYYTISQIIAGLPNAIIANPWNGAGASLVWNMGDTATSYQGFVGNLDNLAINLGAFSDTHDFEFTAVVAATGGFDVANKGMIQINASGPMQALGCPDCETARTATGDAIILPHDWDGNGFDTYVVTGCVEMNDTIYTSIFLGSANWGWVDLYDSRVEIISEGLPASCLP